MQRSIVQFSQLCALAVLSVACQSNSQPETPKPSPNGAVRIALTDYRNSQRLEIVNESHTGRVEQYSKVGSNANRKVQSDDIVDALIEHFDRQGYEKLAQQGHAPAEGGGTWKWSLELETARGTSFVAIRPDVSATEAQPYLAMKGAFLTTYNATYGLQAVKVEEGETPFKAPDPPKSVKQH